MEIIPVIDLKHGHVVHARRGDRASYAPLVSTLCESSLALPVAAALINFCHPRHLYIADLDAISGEGDHRDEIGALHNAFPEISLWVDAGFKNVAAISTAKACFDFVPVLGSESITSIDTFSKLIAAAPTAVISLDFRGESFIGPPELINAVANKPNRIIHLNLKQVGSSAGPDFAGIEALRKRAPNAQIYCGGGVRDMDDLRQLDALGVQGALVATALHEGSLARIDFLALASAQRIQKVDSD